VIQEQSQAKQLFSDSLTSGDIIAQLDRILADSRFASADRSSRFLRYVVENTLSGRAGEIKEIVIATEFYGRSSDYDPKTDSIVRVEASRLRAKLDSYYEHQGAKDPLRITIPKGSYVPKFERISSPEQPDTELPGSDSVPPVVEFRPPQRVSRLWDTRSATILMTSILVLGFWGYAKSIVDGAGAGPTRISAHVPHPEALAAWREATNLFDQDPHTALMQRGVPPPLERALERLEFAVAKDPLFARAWASLAEAYDYTAPFVGRDAAGDARRAEEAARKAVALDDKLPAGHAMLGLVLFYMRWNFKEAETEYRRALELDPHNAFATVEYADLLRETGRVREAEEVIRKARALMPAMNVLAVKDAEIQLDQNRPDAALATATAALRFQKDSPKPHVALGMAWEAKGDYERALAHYRDALAIDGLDRRALPAYGYLLGVMGRTGEARSVARKLEDINSRIRNCAFQIAVVYAGLRDYERSIYWLERAFQTRQMHLPFLTVEYRFQPLRKHPRFRAIVDRLGLKLRYGNDSPENGPVGVGPRLISAPASSAA
jgi:tetratricopeptide (TPR) repeat protein